MTRKQNTPAPGSRAKALTALLADAPKADDHDGVRKYLHGLAALRCAPLLVMPRSKQPADMRTPQRRRADDRAAQRAARETGRRNWQRVKSPAGLALATTDTAALDGYLDRYVQTYSKWADADGNPVYFDAKVHAKTPLQMIEPVAVNVAAEVGASGLVVIDCDTAAQKAAFLAETEADADTAPTVRSPGQRDPVTGEWLHSDGGHFWFVVPESVELPTASGAMTLGDGDDAARYAVLWRQRYVLLPPSVRAEGPYAAVGAVYPLSEWLCERITEHARLRAERARHSRDRADDDNPVTTWGATITWAEILSGIDWTATGKPASCGCETWTAPGAHASPKSATAHELGCARWDSPDPPLHVWTNHDVEPFGAVVDETGSPTITRLRAVAAIDHDSDIGAAMAALGVHDDDLSFAGPDGFDVADSDDTEGGDCQGDDSGSQTQQAKAKRRLQITWAADIEPEPVVWLWVDITARNTWSPDAQPGTSPDPFAVDDIACVASGHEWSPPEVETDGRIACGMVSVAAGREGSGKSSFGIWLTAKITRGELPGAHYGVPRRVFYLATEDSWKHTLVPRLIAAGADMSMIARVEVVVNERSTVTLSLPEDIDMLTESITENQVALVVIDPLMSTLGAGLDANASRDVRTALEPISAMAERTGAAVVAIAHFNKATGLDSLSRITGSGAFKDVARAVMVFARDGDERVFTQPKNSVGRDDLPSLHYEIRQAVVDTPKGKTATGKFAFTGCADRSVDEMLAEERSRKRRKSPVTSFVVDYVTEHADEQTGEVDAADVIAAGEAEGFSAKQVIDARARCTDPKINTRREGFGANGQSFWKIERP